MKQTKPSATQMSPEAMQQTIKRALISVSDKTGLEQLAVFLKERDVQIISTGGTAKMLRDNGLDVMEIADYTGSPEIMDGRVKTLHPKVHGGLLGRLDDKEHLDAMKQHDIPSIDLVIVNLYPFEETVARGADFDEVVENIDIGGPSMVRSAAKNHAFTTIITDSGDYEALMAEMNNNNGATTEAFRTRMAAKAFAKTASYDAAISSWFARQQNTPFPATLNLTATLKQTLRYGENPHQGAAFYALRNGGGIAAAKQLQGKELSYNNINDADAALQQILEFNEPAVAIIKHANPCGVAVGDNIHDAYIRALASDPVSAFGGIIAFNRTINEELAHTLSKMFVEAIIAPDIDDAAQGILQSKKNLRLLVTGHEEMTTRSAVPASGHEHMVRSVKGGLLVQEYDTEMVREEALKVVTRRAPNPQESAQLRFAFKVCKHVKSNAIVLVKDFATIGIGAGQTSRVDSVRIAAMKAADCQENPNRAKGSVLASDAFFPFADGLLQAIDAGITAVIQPGGSIRDEEVIEAADKHDIAMVFTGQRHFKH